MSMPAKNRTSNMGTYGLMFEHDEVVQLLRAAVEREENQVAYAKHNGVDRAHLNQILNGRKGVCPSFLKALGLRNVYAKADY
jgi:hypothetical protein